MLSRPTVVRVRHRLLAHVAVADAIATLDVQPDFKFIASVSVGIVEGTPLLDLEYVEDSNAETDMNVVMCEGGQFIEVQGTAEAAPFSRSELDAMLNLAEAGIDDLFAAQKQALAGG